MRDPLVQAAMTATGLNDAVRACETTYNGRQARCKVERRIINTTTWKVERTVPAGEIWEIVGFSNAGFRGIEVSLREVSGDRKRSHGVPVADIELVK